MQNSHRHTRLRLVRVLNFKIIKYPEIMSVKSNYAPVKSKISTSPPSGFVLSAETQRFAVTDSHPHAFSFFHLLPSEYGSNFKSWRWRESNPRPKRHSGNIYMLRLLFFRLNQGKNQNLTI